VPLDDVHRISLSKRISEIISKALLYAALCSIPVRKVGAFHWRREEGVEMKISHPIYKCLISERHKMQQNLKIRRQLFVI